MEPITPELCEQMFAEAVEYANSGDAHAAIAGFDRLLAVCASQPEPWMATLIAAALFNKATVHRLASATDDAVKLFDEIVTRFGASDDRQLQLHVCKALYNKGIALQAAQRWTQAIAAFNQVITVCKDSPDSGIRERVALSMGAKAVSFLELKQADEAAGSLAQLVTAFDGSPEPTIQQAIGEAVWQFPALLLRLKPAAHAAHSPFNLSLLQEIETLKQDPENAEVVASYEKAHLEFVRDDLAAAARNHADALAIFKEYATQGTPFALFLRSFDLEASERMARPTDDTFQPIHTVKMGYAEEVEDRLADLMKDKIRAIGIWNPSAIEVRSEKSQIPKLELQNGVWQYVLHLLVRHAAFIMIRLESLTPGVTIELNAISTAGRENVAVAVLPAPDAPDDHALEDAITSFLNQKQFSPPSRSALSTDQFAGFALVLSEPELQNPEMVQKVQEVIVRAQAAAEGRSRTEAAGSMTS